MFYNKKGKKISIEKWSELIEDIDYKIVKQENIGKLRVSTVWLGINHSFDGGKPLIFETMVFGGDEEMQERYSTLEEAEKGHEKIANEIRKEKK